MTNMCGLTMNALCVQETRLRAGQAFSELPLEAVKVSGPERHSWLHNITTADFSNIQPGASIEGLVLNHQGHIQHAFASCDTGESTWLLVDSGQSAPLANFLMRMRFMMRVHIEIVPIQALGVMLPEALLPEPVRAAADLVWNDPWPQVLPGGAHYGLSQAEHPARNAHRTILVNVTDSPHVCAMLGTETVEFLAHEQDNHAHPFTNNRNQSAVTTPQPSLAKQGSPLPALLEAANFSQVSLAAWEGARIVDRRPRPNTEAARTLNVLPHELDWLRTAVSLTKGCFPGQEAVAKVVNMGKPARRLVFLRVERHNTTSADIHQLPERGSGVRVDGDNVGVLTSIGCDDTSGIVALALVKRSIPLDAMLQIASATSPGFIAFQESIVSIGGRSSASPDCVPGAALRKARAELPADQKPRPRTTPTI